MRRLIAIFMVLFVTSVGFGQTNDSSGCVIEVRAEAGYSPAAHNLYIGNSGYFKFKVAQEKIGAEVCTNKKLQYGGSVAWQQALNYKGKTADDKVGFGGHVSYKFSKGFTIKGSFNKDSFGGWRYYNAAVEVSKKFQLGKHFSVTVKNTTYRIWHPKQLTYNGHWLNKTSVPLSVTLKKRVTLTFAPGISFDDNVYNSGIAPHKVGMGWASGRADVAVGKGFGVYAAFDWYTKLRWGGLHGPSGRAPCPRLWRELHPSYKTIIFSF